MQCPRFVLCLVGIWLSVAGIQAAHATPTPQERMGERPGSGAADQAIGYQPDVIYTSVGKRQLQLDLYLPKQADGTNPVAVYIHGGGWTKGSRRMGRFICQPLAQRGYVTASIDYRLAQEAGWPAQIQDCQAAVQWLEENIAEYGGDPRKMVVTGGSAGGQLALSLACGWGETWDNPLRACCSWYGPTDMGLLTTVPKVSGNLQLYLGQTRYERERRARQASPLLFVDLHDPPVLFIHGTKDPLVNVEHSRRMHAALVKANIPSEIVEVPGGRHGALLASPDEMSRLVQRMIDWFDQQLSRESAAPIRAV
jgi:acetyl esterase/lipase